MNIFADRSLHLNGHNDITWEIPPQGICNKVKHIYVVNKLNTQDCICNKLHKINRSEVQNIVTTHTSKKQTNWLFTVVLCQNMMAIKAIKVKKNTMQRFQLKLPRTLEWESHYLTPQNVCRVWNKPRCKHL